LAGILAGSGRFGRISCKSGRDLAKTAGFRSTGRDPAVFWQILPESGTNGQISATMPEFVCVKYKKKIFLYYFNLTFFIL
jgi:hypothetical protein